MIVGFWLIVVLLFLPFGMGLALVPARKIEQVYLTGLCASWGLYEILALLFHCTFWPLHVMTMLWVGCCVLTAMIGFYRQRAVLREWRQHSYTLPPRGELLLAVFVVALVLAQALHVALSTYYGNWDDSTYCAIASTSWYTDTANRYSPNTGAQGWILYGNQYVLAFWPVFSASLAQLTGVHPAIVFRTVMPVFEISLAYGIFYLLARFFFKESRQKALWTIVWVICITLVAADKMGGNCAEWWLTVNPWTGKAIASNIMVPLSLWILFHLETTVGTKEQHSWWRSLFVACLASCLVAGTMFVLVPAELAIWGIFYLLRTKIWKDIFKFAGCALPALLCCAVVYRTVIFGWAEKVVSLL